MSKKPKYLSKDDIIIMDLNESIFYLHDLMKKHIINAGIPEASYSKIEKVVDSKQKLILREYLLEVYLNEHEKVRVAWNHLPEHAWEKYKTHFPDFTSPEHTILSDAQKLLRSKWRERPDFLKKKRKKNNEKGHSENTE